MADNSNINIKVQVTGQDATAVQQETARRIHATTAAYSGPQNAQAYAATRGDAVRAAQAAADATQRSARAQWQHSVTQPKRTASGAIETDKAGNPVMETVGTVSANERVQPQVVADRERRFQARQAQQARGVLQEAKEEAASHRIRFVDQFGGRWRPGTVERLLQTAEQNPDTPEGRDALREAKQMTGFIRKGTTTEYHARRGEAKRDDLLDRLATARASVDTARASTRVQRILRDVDTLADDIRNARRTSLATPEGKRRLGDLKSAVGTIESEATRQTREDTRAQAATNREEAQAQRFARTIEAAGRVAGIRAAVGGAQTVAQSLIGGNVVQAGGGLLHTVGSTMHHVGLGRMAAARAAGATGAAAGAGRLLSGAGAAVMVGAKLVTTGLERGYENSERADRFMGQAEPLFDLRARQYATAHGGRGVLRTMDSLTHVGSTQPAVATISRDRAMQLAMGAAPQTEAEGRLATSADAPANILSSVPDGGLRYRDRVGLRRTPSHVSQKAKEARTAAIMSKYDEAYTPEETAHDTANKRAKAAMAELSRLRAYGLTPETALSAYGSFTNQHGIAGMGLEREVNMMISARKTGESDSLQAEMMRVANLSGEGVGSLNAMTTSLTRAGVIGAPQHGVIASFLQQMASEQARGLSPSTYVAANAIDSMSKSGVKYPVMGTVRGMASQAVEHNLAGPRAFAQALLNTHVGVNAYSGRSYDEGTKLLGEDPMEQAALAFSKMPEAIKERFALGAGPAQTKELVDAFNNMQARDLRAAPVRQDDAVSPETVFDRMGQALWSDWGLVGKERNISAIRSGQAFKISLDDAANALRAAADAAAVFAIGGD